MSRNFLAHPELYPWCDPEPRSIDLPAVYAAMDAAARCSCRYEREDMPGAVRVPNLQCREHGLRDAAAEAVGRILGGA